jgi:NTE family protein
MSEQGRSEEAGNRLGVVLSGGGARGAYEAGVLSYVFEHVYPRLGPDFEFDIVSGTSVGAIHAAYIAASAGADPIERAKALVATWAEMTLDRVLRLSVTDLAAVPLRALGLEVLTRSQVPDEQPDLLGGLVDISPLEQLVGERIPWSHLRENLDRGRPGALCVACTEIHTGIVRVFIDGKLADPTPWDYDPYTMAVKGEISSMHVRASAAIPFLFPAVRVGDAYYLDGGLRVNTPLAPALRLKANKVLVVGLKKPLEAGAQPPDSGQKAITQPAFLLGKVLNVLLLDQLEHELKRLDVINSLIEGASDRYGTDCIDNINDAIRAKRGVEYRKVDPVVIRPSADLGAICADAYHRGGGKARSAGLLPSLLARMALRGVPENEADLLSYLFFDSSYTEPLIELGRDDARRQEDEILAVLGCT